MLDTLAPFLLKLFLYLFYSIVLYNVYILVTKFRCVKFAWNNNMFFMPLLPFIGTAYLAVFGKAKASVLQAFIRADKYFGGLPCNFWFGSTYMYATNIAEEARIILNHPKCLNKSMIYDNIEVVFKNCILTIPVEKWKPRRHYLRPAFKMNMIKSSYATYYDQSCLLLKDIKKLQPEDNLFSFFNKYAFMNFFLSSFGLNDASKANTNITRIGSHFDTMQDELVKLLINPAIPTDVWKNSFLGSKFREVMGEVKSLLKEVLMQYIEQHKYNPDYLENASDIPLIGLLLDDGYNKDSEDDLYEEFTFITGAATDTTGHTLAFCFVLLGMHPEIQAKAYQEIKSVVGDRSIEFTDIPKLKFVEAVICETLRIFPTIPLFARYCGEDINLGNKVIPKGADAIVSAYNLHRNPEYWDDPLKFDPTRFLPENASKIVPGSYAPFSLGPRNCIGQTWATTLSKMTVANVIRSFITTSSHKSVNEFELESCISMKTINHLDCQFVPRN